MANKIVSLLLQVKNKLSPGAREAADDLRKLNERTSELESSLSKFDKAQDAVTSLDSAREAASETEAAFEDAQLQVEKLKQAFKSEKTPELGVALEKSKVAAREAKKEWQASAKAVTQLENVVTSAGGDLNDLAATEKKFANEIEFANGKLKAHVERVDQVRRGLKEAGTQAEKTTGSIGGTIAKVGAFVGSLVIVDKLKDAFFGLAESTFEVASQFENLGKRLTPEQLGYVTEFARTTPLQLDQVAESFAKLRAFGVDPMNGSLRALVDQNAALGGSYETLTGLVNGIGQAWAKQKLQGEEILQLVERGVPVWDLLAKATGKNTVELQKMSSAGELGRKEMALLLAEIAKANDGKAAEAMDSLSGLVSNLQDDITAFYLRVSQNGALESFKQALRDVREQIQLMADDGRLDKVATGLANLFSSAIRWGSEAASSLNNNFGQLVGSAQIAANSIAIVFNGLRAGVTGAVAVVLDGVSKLASFAGFDEFAEKSQYMADGFATAWQEASADVRANLDGIGNGAGKLGKSFTQLTQEAAAASEASAEAVDKVSEVGAASVDAGQAGAQSLSQVAQAMEDTAEKSEKASEGVRGVKQDMDGLSDSAASVGQELTTIMGDLTGWFQSVRSEISALSESAGAAFDNRLGIDSTGPVTEIEAVRAALQAARDELSAIATDNLQVFDVTGVNKFKNAVLQAKDETVIAYNEQKVKALEYLEALQSGEPLGRRFLANAERSLNTMNLLGSQDLATLRSALSAANNELQQIRDNASDAVDNLQNQLDQLRGNTDAIAQREYEQKRAELDAKLAEAKAFGDNEAIRSYSQALQLLNQVRQEQIKQAKAAASGSSSAAASTASQSAPAQSTRVVDTVNVNLNVGGETIPVQSSRDDAARLVTVLQEFKNRSGA